MLPLMVASPSLIFSSVRSLRRTSRPASAQTWAMPLPICPAPMTPTVLISVPVPCAIRLPRAALAAFLTSEFREFLLELRQDLEEVADEAVIGDLEDRRLLVLVDGD